MLATSEELQKEGEGVEPSRHPCGCRSRFERGGLAGAQAFQNDTSEFEKRERLLAPKLGLYASQVDGRIEYPGAVTLRRPRRMKPLLCC